MYGFLLVFYSNFVPKTHRFWHIRLQKCCDLQNWVRSPSRSLELSPFDRAHMTSYSRSIVTMALSHVVWDIQCRKMSWPWNLGQRSLKVIDIGTIQKTGYGFRLVFYNNFFPKMHHYWDTGLVSIHWPWNPGQESLKFIRTDMYWSATCDFLLMFHSNHRTISYHFRDKRWFQSIIAKFSYPHVFCASAEGVPIGIGYQCSR